MLEPRREIGPFQVLHDHVRGAGVEPAHVDHAGDVLAFDADRSACFAIEAGDDIRVGERLRSKSFRPRAGRAADGGRRRPRPCRQRRARCSTRYFPRDVTRDDPGRRAPVRHGDFPRVPSRHARYARPGCPRLREPSGESSPMFWPRTDRPPVCGDVKARGADSCALARLAEVTVLAVERQPGHHGSPREGTMRDDSRELAIDDRVRAILADGDVGQAATVVIRSLGPRSSVFCGVPWAPTPTPTKSSRWPVRGSGRRW